MIAVPKHQRQTALKARAATHSAALHSGGAVRYAQWPVARHLRFGIMSSRRRSSSCFQDCCPLPLDMPITSDTLYIRTDNSRMRSVIYFTTGDTARPVAE